MLGKASAHQHDRSRRADLEALRDSLPGDRRDRAGLVPQHHPEEVLAVALLTALALAHHEGAIDLIAVAELAKGAGSRRLRAYLVVEQAVGHPSLKVEAHPDRTLRPIWEARLRQPAVLVAALGGCAISGRVARRSSSAPRTRLRPSALAS